MRFRSKKVAAGQVFAVSGVNTISFAIVAGKRTKDGLLGFAVERIDPAEGEHFFMAGFKVFQSVIPHPDEKTQVSTFDHPVQSFVWDDFTAKPDHEYEYRFHPVKGKPKNLDHAMPPLSITVHTEPLVSGFEHDIFFNRGVASSQAYQRRFGATPIAALKPKEKQDEALRWLSRDLADAVLRFIDSCASGDRLLCCFYEFRYEPVAKALKNAMTRGVDVKLIVDAKVNETTDKDGTFHPSFPREDNLAMIAHAKIPKANVILRQARADNIQHNKFMVRVVGGEKPSEVWTGSTNMSLGGIAGQTNVGHWLRNAPVATQFAQYWDLLATDPGGVAENTPAETKSKNKAFRAAVETMSPVGADLTQIARGTTAVFSPRLSNAVLGSYAALLDAALQQACITLAFGISNVFKDLLKDNTAQSQLVFMLLEKKDAPNPKSKTAFVAINASNNVYKAWGSFIRDPVYQWARETNAALLGLNQHVSYIHSKFMLVDPLGADPTVITGSANFSNASTGDNDENMIIVRGDRRVADIYLTEFNRLFNHYYFRSVTEDVGSHPPNSDQPSLFLAETADWQKRYAPGSLKAKRLQLYAEMTGFSRP
jgi:phosphatidylserine/phosphatidylglycerophosphate/cardiolipin synthase-like enzyme